MHRQYRIEPHSHTAEISHCGCIPAAGLAIKCHLHGYDSIVITDHLNEEHVSSLPFNDNWDAVIDHFKAHILHHTPRALSARQTKHNTPSLPPNGPIVLPKAIKQKVPGSIVIDVIDPKHLSVCKLVIKKHIFVHSGSLDYLGSAGGGIK